MAAAASSPALSNNGSETTADSGGKTAAVPSVLMQHSDPSKNLRGLNKPKCITCGNVARSRLILTMRVIYVSLLLIVSVSLAPQLVKTDGDQPLSNIAIRKTKFALHDMAYINASPTVLGVQGENSEWVTLDFVHSQPSNGDWIGVFSPANFSATTCAPESARAFPPLLCTAPIKFQYANYSNPEYQKTGKGTLKLQLINQRSDFSFALFTGGLLNVDLGEKENPRILNLGNLE